MNSDVKNSALHRIRRFVQKYCEKSGTIPHPDKQISEAVVMGLAQNLALLGKPLCPCRFYPNKEEEVKHRTWICACDDMQIYKYCHCLLFVNQEGRPITEYLPVDHVGRENYGLVRDPTPSHGRPLRHMAEMRERERKLRHS